MSNFAIVKFKPFVALFFLFACQQAGNGIKEMNPEEFKVAISKSNAQLIDVRSKEQHNNAYISNSILFDSTETKIDKLENQLYTKLPVYIYSDEDKKALALANHLKNKGFADVNILQGGIQSWKKNSYNVEEVKIYPNDTISFEKAMMGDKLVMVDFNATWCGPCKMLEPAIHKVRERTDDVIVYGIDIDENRDLANSYNAANIPLLVFIKNGKELDRMVGLRPASEIEAMVDKYK
jgi:thioredoxin 1